MHVVEVDQSGKFEYTTDDTVLAFSNGITFSLLIPAQVKRDCIITLRDRGIAGPTYYTQLFATGLYFLLRHHIGSIASVSIDREYPGKDNQIKQHLLNLLHRQGYSAQNEQFAFTQIGKHSPAHFTALAVFRGERQPDVILSGEQLLGEFRGKKNRGLPRR